MTLIGGSASYGISSLTAGLHSITAEYPGDGNFIGTSSTLSQQISRPPIAGADRIERTGTNEVKVLLTILLANDSDPDGQTFGLQSIGPASAHGGTVTVSEGWVYYVPPAGFTSEDSFTYVITNAFGATATGTVTVAIRTEIPPSLTLRITLLPGGSFNLRFDGVPGRTYRVEYAESLTLPTWQPIGSRTADSLGVFEMTHTPPPGAISGFYRAVYP